MFEGLKDKINLAVVIESGLLDGKVHVGSTITLLLNGQLLTVTILGSTESAPGQGRISRGSPLGAALLGHSVGDVYEKYIGNAEARIEIQSVA